MPSHVVLLTKLPQVTMPSLSLPLLALIYGCRMTMADNSADVIRIELEDHKNNLTALQTVIAPPWVSSQSIRSTSAILWSCIITLTACIYTSLHLNISTKSGWQHRSWEKIKWVIVAILAPEIVVYMAFSQYLEARLLFKKLNKEMEEKEGEKVHPEFDLRYGFFVVMGGLQVSYGEDTKTLLSEAVVSLAEKGEFIRIPRESIDDRSKADAVKKTLVLFQVSWMVMQCISRKAYGLPLTLLEIHTMVHVVCAFILYICWFEKPLDVLSPDILSFSNVSDRLKNLLESLQSEDGAKLKRSKSRHKSIYMYPWGGLNNNRILMFKESRDSPFGVNMTRTISCASMLHSHAPWLLKVAVFLLPALYGGIHLTAWNSDFPSLPEQLMWKITCFIIIGTLPSLGIVKRILHWVIQRLDEPTNDRFIMRGVCAVLVGIAIGILILFTGARLYIVVEAFISLRGVPIGVYLIPEWLQMIPHI